MNQRVLITGIGGFTGRYLAEELQRAGYQVFGLIHPGASDGANYYPCDLEDKQGLKSVIESIQPDIVAHLAAISFPAHGDRDAIYRVNLLGSIHLLEALSLCARVPKRILMVSSGNIYGNSLLATLPETTPPAPENDYAVSKLAMEHAAWLWRKKLPLVIVRPFNYTGIGQSLQFLPAKIVDHFRRGEKVIELGNIDVARDFSDVRDVVHTYRLLIESSVAEGKVFNVCSGRSYRLLDLLNIMADIAGYAISVRVNPALVRQNEVARQCGANDLLRTTIGYAPQRPLEETLAWMYQQSAS